MKEVKGNLVSMAINDQFNVIVHGCNCFCTFSSGIAAEVKRRLPRAYSADQKTVVGDWNKLGSYSKGEYGGLTIINMYTQYRYDASEKPCDYKAIESGFAQLNQEYAGRMVKIGIPLIGAGLAGGDWNRIKDIIEKACPDLDITVVHFDGSK